MHKVVTYTQNIYIIHNINLCLYLTGNSELTVTDEYHTVIICWLHWMQGERQNILIKLQGVRLPSFVVEEKMGLMKNYEN